MNTERVPVCHCYQPRLSSRRITRDTDRCYSFGHSALGTILSTAAIAMASSGGSKEAPAPVAEQKNIETGSK
jgi:hypothetical protein